MLIRDWLQTKSSSDEAFHLDDVAYEQGISYINEMASNDSSQVDVDVLAAIDDLNRLGLISQNRVKDEEEAHDTLKKLWGESFDRLDATNTGDSST